MRAASHPSEPAKSNYWAELHYITALPGSYLSPKLLAEEDGERNAGQAQRGGDEKSRSEDLV